MKTRFAFLAPFMIAAVAFAASAPAPKRPPLLANGTSAPDFTALRPDNTPAKLSDFRGSFVLVDFWATWCPPCKVSMPHREKIYQKLKDQGLVVLGVCLWDSRPKFGAWRTNPEVPTSYLKVFDPAGDDRKVSREQKTNIASKLHGVSGIPTFYLIDKEGKVAFSGVGSGPQTEKALDRALAAAGFKL